MLLAMALELDDAAAADDSSAMEFSSRESLPPMCVIVYFHKAIRLELERIHDSALSLDRSSGKDFQSLAKRYNFLREIYEQHSQAEDEVILPALDSRVKNVARSYCLEHVVENDLLNEMSQLLGTDLSDQTDSSWQEIISCTEAVQRTVCQHLSKEESQVIPLLIKYFNREEQASLVWRFIGNIPVSLMETFLPWLASSLSAEECRHMELCIEEIVPAEGLLQEVISGWFKRDHSKFRLGGSAARVKASKRSKVDARSSTRLPINDLTHWHQAIKRELLQITEEVKDLTSLSLLSERMEFVSKVWSFHSAAEDKFVFLPIGKKLDHGVQDELCSSALRGLENALKNSSATVSTQAELLFNAVEAHFFLEETEILPLASQRFSIDEQRTLVYESLRIMPLVLLRRVLPWIVNCVSAQEATDMLINIRLAAPQRDSTLVALLIGWACENHSHVWELLKNESSRVSGKRICQQLRATRPFKHFRNEVSLISKSLQVEHGMRGGNRSTGNQKLKPIDQIFQFHKAIRKDLEYLDAESARLVDCNDEFFEQFRGRFYFLWGLYRAHSSAEDTIVFPALEAKEPLLNVSHSYMIDHRQEEDLFNEIAAVLSTLSTFVTQAQEKTEEYRAQQHFLAAKLQRMCKSMRICLGKHVDREESELWPLFDKHFSVQEQDRVMARIIGSTGAEVIQAMLPWVTAVLTEEERNSMMETWEQATRNTLFQDWLNAWWKKAPSTSHQNLTDTTTSTKDCLQSLIDYFSDKGKCEVGDTPDEAGMFKPGWPEIFRLNQEELEAAVRKLSTDSSLDPRRKAYLMQNLMTCRWMVAQQKLRDQRLTDSEPAPSYADEEAKVFGCKHYRRNCKLRAACCGSLFTCRLCHDESSDHKMDRYQTSEMMCMQCLKVQAIGPSCKTPSCNKYSMGRYYCSICKFFDDDPKRSIYHCPFCNICRVGSGLGNEYFHCMVCNGCMSKALEETHVCREKGTETDCPICCEQIFSSVPDVKALPCGHFMHSACFAAYSSNHYTCPICCKTLGNMGMYFGMLDALLEAEQLPEEYRDRKENIFCNDCERKGEAKFHWLYHKCGACGSFNTRTI